MPETGVKSTSVDQHNPLNPQQQHEITIDPVASQATTNRLRPNLPRGYLLRGSRENYLKFGIPLYEASITCDWKAAKSILDQKPKLVRYSITENSETALHIAASAKGAKLAGKFVQNLMDLMEEDDLALENEQFNTALFLAASAGNIELVKIMVKKNRKLVTIPGGMGMIMPLTAAALYGNYGVVKYLYEYSDDLCDAGWDRLNRLWLLENCVENDMFDIALKIVKKYPELNNGSVLLELARKPEAFQEIEYGLIWRTIKLVSAVTGLKVTTREQENYALQLLRIIWEDIAKRPKMEIDRILRGMPDPVKLYKLDSGRILQALQLEKLISKHVAIMREAFGKIVEARELQDFISEQLVSMHVETQNISSGTQDSMKENNYPGKGDQALELHKLITEYMVNVHVKTLKVIRGPYASRKEDQALHLQELISKYITKLCDETQMIIIRDPSKLTYSSRILFVAAETGNTDFLVEIIRQYPDVVWKVNDENQSIFHIAVKHRHEGIYNLLYEIGTMIDFITPLRDPEDNNMLHLLGKIETEYRLKDMSGVALQMQRELLWFNEVWNMIPPLYRDWKNKEGLTPYELFTRGHKDVLAEGKIRMKEIAGQCMLVAALVATMVFAAAFTVPGGYDQNNGMPLLHSKSTFKVFVVADAISLFTSSASILHMFLSVFTSRFAQRDFLESLPKKLIVGLSLLFLSITSMIVAFSVSFFVLYEKGLLWIPIIISIFAMIPFLIYVKLQLTLFVEVFRLTYRSRYLFKPKKHVLYHKSS